jgi:elongation factor G
MKAFFFDGENGEDVRIEEIPARFLSEAQAKREELIDAASMFSDRLTEVILEEGEVTEAILLEALREGTLKRGITPVFLGSAYKNKGVQPLLDGIAELLPHPAQVQNTALDMAHDETPVSLESDPSKPTVALAFKLEDGAYGQLTYIRVLSGHGCTGFHGNQRTIGQETEDRKGRSLACRPNGRHRLKSAGTSAPFSASTARRENTFMSPGLNVTMTSMYIPEPVISLAIVPKDNKAQINMSKALNRFTKEDPTFKTHMDEETNETIIEGMGELHLEVYVERMRREYSAEVATGKPRVAYRETITQRADFNYTHKKQTGGSGQYGRVAGFWNL